MMMFAPLNHSSLKPIHVEGFGKPATPTGDQVVALIMAQRYITWRWKQTRIPTRRQRHEAATNIKPHTRTETAALHLTHTRKHTRRLRRYGALFDNRQVDLALVGLE